MPVSTALCLVVVARMKYYIVGRPPLFCLMFVLFRIADTTFNSISFFFFRETSSVLGVKAILSTHKYPLPFSINNKQCTNYHYLDIFYVPLSVVRTCLVRKRMHLIYASLIWCCYWKSAVVHYVFL